LAFEFVPFALVQCRRALASEYRNAIATFDSRYESVEDLGTTEIYLRTLGGWEQLLVDGKDAERTPSPGDGQPSARGVPSSQPPRNAGATFCARQNASTALHRCIDRGAMLCAEHLFFGHPAATLDQTLDAPKSHPLCVSVIRARGALCRYDTSAKVPRPKCFHDRRRGRQER